jgi:hypothetical protein
VIYGILEALARSEPKSRLLAVRGARGLAELQLITGHAKRETLAIY